MSTAVIAGAHAVEKHPKGLYVLFFTEMWERFSFYTVGGMWTLYVQNAEQGFGYTQDRATSIWSYYLMFVYASPLVGGWIADRKLGYRKSVMLGGLFFMAGHALLAVPKIGAGDVRGPRLSGHRQRLLQTERLGHGRQPLSRGEPSQGPRLQHLLHGHQRRRLPRAGGRRVHDPELRLPSRLLHGRPRHGDLRRGPLVLQAPRGGGRPSRG